MSGTRSLWQGPRGARDRPEHRSVTFLELFYDLVFVVLVAQVAHELAAHPTPSGFGVYVFVFAIVWWAWANGTLHHELHGADDTRTRTFTFLQMGAVGAMAAFAHDAIGEGSVGFALSYAVLHALLTWLWFSAGTHHPEHRVLSRPVSVVFAVTTVLLVVSVFVPPPLRYGLWATGLVLDLAVPLVLGASRKPAVRAEMDRVGTVTHSMSERFGLFTIIVLGEIMVGAIGVLRVGEGVTLDSAWIFAAGIGLGVALWLVYFDAVALRLARAGRRPFLAWMFAHLVVAASVSAVGAAVAALGHADPGHGGHGTEAGMGWLLTLAVIGALVGMVVLIRVRADDDTDATRGETLAHLAVIALAAGVGALIHDPRWLLTTLAVLVAVPPTIRFMRRPHSLAG